MRPSLSAANITSLSIRLGCIDMPLSSVIQDFLPWGEHRMDKPTVPGRLLAMSLEACPTCGYAVSTTNSRCRHCSALPQPTSQIEKAPNAIHRHVLMFLISI